MGGWIQGGLVAACRWVLSTSTSQTLQNILWVVPALQVVHILVIGALFSSVVMISLRLLGVVNTDQPLAIVSARYLRIIWWSLPILLLTGSILVFIEPVRDLLSPAFQLKIVLIIAAAAATLAYQRALAGNPGRFEAPDHRLTVAVVAAVGLLLWIGVVFAGRWIAYAPGRG